MKSAIISGSMKVTLSGLVWRSLLGFSLGPLDFRYDYTRD